MSDDVVAAVQAKFSTFGGERAPDPYNPISHWMTGSPAIFAAGVPVAEVCELVEKLARARIRAKVEEMLAKAEFTEELDKLLRWLDGEGA